MPPSSSSRPCAVHQSNQVPGDGGCSVVAGMRGSVHFRQNAHVVLTNNPASTDYYPGGESPVQRAWEMCLGPHGCNGRAREPAEIMWPQLLVPEHILTSVCCLCRFPSQGTFSPCPHTPYPRGHVRSQPFWDSFPHSLLPWDFYTSLLGLIGQCQ